ncbi:MAG TPA: VanZ family protein [Bryobacteraceae bacterium]|nr:VanZ family protein [Bryobacteraceae bacterium]
MGNALWYLLHRWDSWRNGYLIRDIFVNVTIYIPVGLLGKLAFRNRSAIAVILFAFVLSVSIELIQVFEPLRQSSMVDVICNSAGAAIGVAAGLAIAALSKRHIADPGSVLLAAGFVLCLLFPLVPLYSRGMIAQNATALLRSPLVSTFPATTALALWYGAGLLLRGTGIRYSLLWLTISLLLISAQLHVIARTLVISELAGGAAGVALLALRPTRTQVSAGEAWGFLLLIAVGSLWPFHFGSRAAPFAMTPFKGLITADGPTSLWIILSQFVAWGIGIRLFTASGMRRWPAIAIVASVVAAAQLIRIFVPGATPGITPPLMAVIAGYVLHALTEKSLNEPQTAV